jgi:hypothetical protein
VSADEGTKLFKNSREPTRPTTALRRQLIDNPAAVPVLLERSDVLDALRMKPGQLDYLVDCGRLDECTVTGQRRLFRSLEVRKILVEQTALGR